MTTFELEIHELSTLVDHLVPLLHQYAIIAFDGDLASGKTTLARHICEKLDVKDDISSPTYAIIHTYETIEHTIYHMDLYRLSSERELDDLGLEELFEQPGSPFFLIEWPDIAIHLLPRPIIWIKIEKTETAARKFSVIIN